MDPEAIRDVTLEADLRNLREQVAELRAQLRGLQDRPRRTGTLAPWLALFLIMATATGLGSETVTMTTYYPAPSGIYRRMTVTDRTILARDGGSVGIGTTSPANKLDVAGDLGVSGPASFGGQASAPSFLPTATVTPGSGCSPNGLIGKVASGSTASCVSGVWTLSSGGTLVQMYQCPPRHSLGGGAWGFYGCASQITNTPTCNDIEYPTSQTFPCTPIGKMVLY